MGVKRMEQNRIQALSPWEEEKVRQKYKTSVSAHCSDEIRGMRIPGMSDS